MSYLLDTSALLAFYFGEPGAERVRDIVSGEHGPVSLSVLTAAEFWSRLRAEGAEGAFEGAWGQVTELVSELRPVTLATVMRAIELRRASTARLPCVDALIAATAAYDGAVLLHRDPHFGSIPSEFLRQEPLPER